MSKEIIRRGPDSYGNYFDRININDISIAHRRLSIIDLSEKGNQPMKSKNGRYVREFVGDKYVPSLNGISKLKKIDSLKSLKNCYL